MKEVTQTLLASQSFDKMYQFSFNILSETILANNKLWRLYIHLVRKQIYIIVNHVQYTISIVLYTKEAYTLLNAY